MIYKFNYAEGVVEFVKNQGRALVEASDPRQAIDRLRDVFEQTRDEKAEAVNDQQYLVTFKVSLDYRQPLLREVEKSVRLMVDIESYRRRRFVDRYVVATIFRETGRPAWMAELEPIREEISALRKAAVVAREIPNIIHFVDWDIVIHNYIELNSREGHRSRVVRTAYDR